MLEETLPVRDKLFDLQKEGKISIYSFTYGLNHSESYVAIEFEVHKTREHVKRTLKGKDMKEAANKAIELLSQVL